MYFTRRLACSSIVSLSCIRDMYYVIICELTTSSTTYIEEFSSNRASLYSHSAWVYEFKGKDFISIPMLEYISVASKENLPNKCLPKQYWAFLYTRVFQQLAYRIPKCFRPSVPSVCIQSNRKYGDTVCYL